ncbi:hypothetical protein CVT26_015501 [Gymnopilus dilepis]|uniref:Rhomboid-type serine protease n=1 Tax=Gymnopilus dilepis TaxID=231916 RepID=A0A409WHS9_9AGAR|nr:hypothetical protein CVT26_015501 [Gymnopilus dilepis]
MSSTQYTRNTDDGNPYTMTYTNQRDSYYYNEPSLGTNQTSGYTDEKHGRFMDSNPDGLDDHSNVSQSRDEVNLGGSRTSGLAYNENESSRHLVDHTAEASPNDPLVPQQMRPYEDLGTHLDSLFVSHTSVHSIPLHCKEYAEPHLQGKPSGAGDGKLKNLFASARYPLDQRIQDKKRGIGRQRHPFVVYGLTVIMVAVFIYELVVNSRQQGSPISLKPVVNPMLGPSSSVLIHVGARFPPCMKLVEQVPPTTALPCMNDTANPVTSVCTVEDLCGFGGFHNETPNQWFRFITAIFLHAGFIHIILNMLAQLTLSAQIEREMGSGGFLITYFAAGIFGNVLGGNFSLVGVPSIGASGAIFGTVAVTWIDLLAHWKYQYRPVRKLIFMAIELLIGIAVGYIPSHIGGFVMGLLVGTVFYPVISTTKRHRVIMWTFRLVAIPIAIILFVILVRNFYTSDPYAACSGCRYLSCFPSAANNHCKGFEGLTTSNTGI